EKVQDAAATWNVTGIGNLKLNIPKAGKGDKSSRPRIVMRRQKTFQVCLHTYLFIMTLLTGLMMMMMMMMVVMTRPTGLVCLNTYLFESMICDKAGPKDVRFTGMKNDSETELATYLIRVKDEESADQFISMIQKHKGTK
ncbi:hypothetical protein T484DRAFT_1776781, partial [Baffinella frigidus]